MRVSSPMLLFARTGLSVLFLIGHHVGVCLVVLRPCSIGMRKRTDGANTMEKRRSFLSFPAAAAVHRMSSIPIRAEAEMDDDDMSNIINDNIPEDRFVKDRHRRTTLQAITLGGFVTSNAAAMLLDQKHSSLTRPVAAAAAAAATLMDADSSELATGLLNSRVTENLLNPPSFGMETPDIFYPAWFAGTWSIASTTTDVLAPCGTTLFGGNQTFATAQQEIGQTLQYDARFLTLASSSSSSSGDSSSSSSSSSSSTIADREYNVRSIAKAAMGANSVLDIPYVTPNKLTCILAPTGSPYVLQVDLLTLNRRQETISETQFDCSEVVQEMVIPASSSSSSSSSSSLRTSRIRKQVETTSLYEYEPGNRSGNDRITCRQRSATYLLPSQQDPVALQLWQASRGRAVDVRYYNVVYTKRT